MPHVVRNHDGPRAGLVRKERESSLSVRTPVLKFHIRAVRAVQLRFGIRRHVARGIRERHHTGISGRQLLRQQRVSLRVRGKPAQNQQGGQHYTSQHIFSLEREHRKRSLRALHFHLTLNPHRAFPIQPGHPRTLPTNNAAGPRPDTTETLSPSAPPGDVFPTETFPCRPTLHRPLWKFLEGERRVLGRGEGTVGVLPFLQKGSLIPPQPFFSLLPTSSPGKHR